MIRIVLQITYFLITHIMTITMASFQCMRYLSFSSLVKQCNFRLQFAFIAVSFHKNEYNTVHVHILYTIKQTYKIYLFVQ